MHGVVRWLARRSLTWFYQDVRILGAERIPPVGPVLLIGNHPNDLPDVLVGYLATPRPVRYVATAAAATSVLVRWTYRGLGVIPVTRVQDARRLRERGIDVSGSNRLAFAEVTAALALGDVVGVFPEGGVFTGPDIGPLRSGVARMALDSVVNGAISDLPVVPLCVQYEAPDRPRSGVVATVGEPMSVRAWLARGHERPAPAFTMEMRRMLRAGSRRAESTVEARHRDRLIAATAASLAARGTEPEGGDALAIAARVAASWRSLAAVPGADDAAVRLAGVVEGCGGGGSSSHDHLVVVHAADPASRFRASGSAAAPVATARRRAIADWPLALPGWLLHKPLAAAAWWLSGRVMRAPSDRAARTIVPGLYLAMLWYLVVALLVALLVRASGVPGAFAPLASLVALLLLPRLGDLGVRWRDALRTLGVARRARGLPSAERETVRALSRTLVASWDSSLNGSAVVLS